MYNGIGLQTPRGSGTSGYVQRNLSYVKPRSTRDDFLKELQQIRDNVLPVPRKPNEEILRHKEKRQVYALLENLREEFKKEGRDPEQIEAKLEEARKDLMKKIENGDSLCFGSSKDQDSHQQTVEKKKVEERVRKALQIDENYKPGSAFDFETQEKQRLQRIYMREIQKNEALRVQKEKKKEKKSLQVLYDQVKDKITMEEEGSQDLENANHMEIEKKHHSESNRQTIKKSLKSSSNSRGSSRSRDSPHKKQSNGSKMNRNRSGSSYSYSGSESRGKKVKRSNDDQIRKVDDKKGSKKDKHYNSSHLKSSRSTKEQKKNENDKKKKNNSPDDEKAVRSKKKNQSSVSPRSEKKNGSRKNQQKEIKRRSSRSSSSASSAPKKKISGRKHSNKKYNRSSSNSISRSASRSRSKGKKYYRQEKLKKQKKRSITPPSHKNRRDYNKKDTAKTTHKENVIKTEKNINVIVKENEKLSVPLASKDRIEKIADKLSKTPVETVNRNPQATDKNNTIPEISPSKSVAQNHSADYVQFPDKAEPLTHSTKLGGSLSAIEKNKIIEEKIEVNQTTGDNIMIAEQKLSNISHPKNTPDQSAINIEKKYIKSEHIDEVPPVEEKKAVLGDKKIKDKINDFEKHNQKQDTQSGVEPLRLISNSNDEHLKNQKSPAYHHGRQRSPSSSSSSSYSSSSSRSSSSSSSQNNEKKNLLQPNTVNF